MSNSPPSTTWRKNKWVLVILIFELWGVAPPFCEWQSSGLMLVLLVTVVYICVHVKQTSQKSTIGRVMVVKGFSLATGAQVFYFAYSIPLLACKYSHLTLRFFQNARERQCLKEICLGHLQTTSKERGLYLQATPLSIRLFLVSFGDINDN